MTDFAQQGPVTTLHDMGTVGKDHLENLLHKATRDRKIALVLPVTAADMRADPFANIIEQLQPAGYLQKIVVVLGMAPQVNDFRQTKSLVHSLGDKVDVIWTNGARITGLFESLNTSGFSLDTPGKGRSVWTAFGFLLADPSLQAFVLHDCDIVNYDREMLARLCLPVADPSLDFDFCKAYYARCTDRMHGRVVRLLVAPLLNALTTMLGNNRFLDYMSSFRYPLSGEFAVSSHLARSNRIPSDWGLEVGTLAEVFRNTSLKRVCQVDVCTRYEHKHQSLSLEEPNKGLLKMATDILTTMFRTLASMGVLLEQGHFGTLRSVYLRTAQDAIRQYHADALMNGLGFDRHEEEQAIEGFAQQIFVAGQMFRENPAGGEAIPNWARILAAFPDFPQQLRQAVRADADDFA